MTVIMMSIDVVTKVIIPIIGAIFTFVLVPLFKAKTTSEQRENIYFWVSVAVNGAEMIYAEKGQGKLKKEYVLEFLSNKRIKISTEELDILIEAAVKELNLIQAELKQD